MSPLVVFNDFMLSTPLLPSSASGSAAILARALPQLRAFSLFAQDAHWQVTGPLFGVLHPMFGDLYDLATGYADAVAERIAQLGNVPPAASKIVVLPIDATQGSLVAAQCARHAQRLGSLLYEAMDQIKDIDPVFLAKFQDWQAQLEKQIWQIQQHAA